MTCEQKLSEGGTFPEEYRQHKRAEIAVAVLALVMDRESRVDEELVRIRAWDVIRQYLREEGEDGDA